MKTDWIKNLSLPYDLYRLRITFTYYIRALAFAESFIPQQFTFVAALFLPSSSKAERQTEMITGNAANAYG